MFLPLFDIFAIIRAPLSRSSWYPNVTHRKWGRGREGGREGGRGERCDAYSLCVASTISRVMGSPSGTLLTRMLFPMTKVMRSLCAIRSGIGIPYRPTGRKGIGNPNCLYVHSYSTARPIDHRIASHRIAWHRIASDRIGSKRRSVGRPFFSIVLSHIRRETFVLPGAWACRWRF